MRSSNRAKRDRRGLFRCAEGRRDKEAQKRVEKKKKSEKFKSGLNQRKIAKLDPISIAIDAGASPAPSSLESKCPAPERSQNS